MADDDEAVYRSARAATKKVADALHTARDHVSTADNSFQGAVGFISWGSLGQKLAKRKACAARYKELQAALAAVDAAIVRAETACAALSRATQA